MAAGRDSAHNYELHSLLVQFVSRHSSLVSGRPFVFPFQLGPMCVSDSSSAVSARASLFCCSRCTERFSHAAAAPCVNALLFGYNIARNYGASTDLWTTATIVRRVCFVKNVFQETAFIITINHTYVATVHWQQTTEYIYMLWWRLLTGWEKVFWNSWTVFCCGC